MQRMADLGFGASTPEAIDGALWQMEGEGMIYSERAGSDNQPSLRRFSITKTGEAYLESWANALGRHQEEVDLFLEAYAGSFVWEWSE